jgi:hypothetical protein
MLSVLYYSSPKARLRMEKFVIRHSLYIYILVYLRRNCSYEMAQQQNLTLIDSRNSAVLLLTCV